VEEAPADGPLLVSCLFRVEAVSLI